jgi:hypothetical protein
MMWVTESKYYKKSYGNCLPHDIHPFFRDRRMAIADETASMWLKTAL